MKHYLLLTTALAGLSVMPAPQALAQSGGGADVPVTSAPSGGTAGGGGGGYDPSPSPASVGPSIVRTTTTTRSYDFPDSDPVETVSSVDVSYCPPVYSGGGGGGGNNGGGMGGYTDTDGDGYGDTHSDGVGSGGNRGNVSSGYGGQTGNAGMGGGGGSGSGESSGSSCFVTTAVITMLGEPDDGPTLTALRRLRDHHVAKTDDGPRRIGAYYLIAPEIVRRIENRVDSRLIWYDTHQRWIGPIRAMVDGGRWHEAERAYGQMMRDLARRYLFAGPDPLPPSIRHYLTGR